MSVYRRPTSTKESAQIHTRHDGERSIQHEYLDVYTGEPVEIGGCILLAGVRHKHDLEAPTAVMSEHEFNHLLVFSKAKGETPRLPKTQIPLEFACRVAQNGTYAYSDGSIKDVVWPKSQLAIEAPVPQLAQDWLYPPAIGAPQAFEPEPQFMQWLSPKTDTAPHAPANEFDHDWAEGVYEVSAAHPLALSSAHPLDPLTRACM
jgi:hypothetical protein